MLGFSNRIITGGIRFRRRDLEQERLAQKSPQLKILRLKMLNWKLMLILVLLYDLLGPIAY